MGKKIDMTGMKYGKLTIVKEVGRNKGHVQWEAKCECGKTASVRGVDVRNGKIVSCGCFHKEQSSKANKGKSPKERKRIKEERKAKATV